MMLTALCVALASVQSLQSPPEPTGPLHLERAVLPGIGEVWLDLRPFAGLDASFRLELGDDRSARSAAGSPLDPDAKATHELNRAAQLASAAAAARAVTLRRGEVVGDARSHAFIAESPRGRVGLIEFGGRRFALAPAEGSWAGPIRGATRWVESTGAGAPMLDEVCRLIGAPCCDHGEEGGVGGHAGMPIDAIRGARVRFAADCDFEFTSMFADSEDAASYVVSLVGAISSIYQREMGISIQLSYLRLWTTPDDPFDAADPLYDFRDHWNATQQGVERDVAHLLTGRRNLPYGGVAWLDAACGEYGYAVDGYLIGSFVDPGRTDPGNWDVIVTAHELGHNLGTLHTHNYDIDGCASGAVLRGGIMSYCHTVSGATANVDLTFHRIVRDAMAEFLVQAPCLGRDCDGDGVEDTEAIGMGQVPDVNGDGVPDGCQDCDGDGVLDPLAIELGAVDLDEDGIPDACQADCNGNGIVDRVDVLTGSSADLWGNLVPDECEVDCDGNGLSDYNEILASMSLDIDRDGRLDSCQDCDGDGTLDAAVLGSSRHWWVATSSGGALGELHPRSGVRVRSSDAAPSSVTDLALSIDGSILGTHGNAVGRWSPVTGDYLGTLVAPGAGGLSQARGLLVMPDGSLLVASAGSVSVIAFTAAGAPAGTFVQLGGFPGPRPYGLAQRSDGVVAVSFDDGFVRGYQWPSGAPVGLLANLALIGPGSDPAGLLFLPDGDLLVASRGLSAIHRFDGVTGAHKGRFDVGPNPGSTIAPKKPTSMRLIADGSVVLVTDNQNGAPIVGFDANSGLHLRTYRVYPVDAPSPTGLLVMPPSAQDCNGNFLPDACDLAEGTSDDRNGDAIPDECQGGPWAAADLDFDGQVDGSDLAIVLGNWGFSGQGDVNGDGVVNGADIALVLGAWTS